MPGLISGCGWKQYTPTLAGRAGLSNSEPDACAERQVSNFAFECTGFPHFEWTAEADTLAVGMSETKRYQLGFPRVGEFDGDAPGQGRLRGHVPRCEKCAADEDEFQT